MTTVSGTSTDEPKQEHTRDFKKSNNADSLGLGTKSWRSLLEVSMARSRKIRGSNYIQLATVDGNEPRCRTVVFRGFQRVPDEQQANLLCDDLSTVMKMCTDARSRKVEEAASDNNVAEIVWWFPKSNEQYRFRGTLLFVGGNDNEDSDKSIWRHARKELWGNLSDAARESFFDPKAPGQPVGEDNKELAQPIPVGGRDEETGKPLPPPDCFLLMLLFPRHVDYLNLKENYRQIDTLEESKSEWSFQTVNA